jgi:hypothetical protein
MLGPEASALLAAVAAEGERVDAAGIDRLRRCHDSASVRVAVELVTARRLALRKFPEREGLLCDRQGIEQATSEVSARWKAKRFGDGAVLDLCCGIGGDSMALAARGPTIGVDHSPVRALMCGHNAGIETRVDDATTARVDAQLVHVDPARRDEASSQRRWSLAGLEPTLEALKPVLDAAEGGAIKLGPGLSRDAELPFNEPTIEFLAEAGRMVQAVAWFGALATAGASRRASDAVRGISVEGVPGRPSVWSSGSAGRFLLVPHVAVERADLLPSIVEAPDTSELAGGLGIFASDTAPTSAWWEAFEVLETLGPRLAKVKAWLREHDAGAVVVRTRDGAIDADGWTRSLSSSGGQEVVVFGLRLARKVVVFATRRVGYSASAP